MSAEISTVVLVGKDRTNTWGAVERRPAKALYIVHFGRPVIAVESAMIGEDWEFPHSMVMGPPDSWPHEVAYFALRYSGDYDSAIDAEGDLPGCVGWTRDPLEFDARPSFIPRIRELAQEARLRLELVRFTPNEFSDENVEQLVHLGFAVDVFDMSRDG